MRSRRYLVNFGMAIQGTKCKLEGKEEPGE